MDDVMFSHNAAFGAQSKTTLCFVKFARWRHQGKVWYLPLPFFVLYYMATRLIICNWLCAIAAFDNGNEINIYYYFYPHMPIGKVWIYRLLFVFFVCLFVCVLVRLRISPPRIKLAVSNFARRFVGVQGRVSPIFW